jgi:pilus assembly protein Flp/PilA
MVPQLAFDQRESQEESSVNRLFLNILVAIRTVRDCEDGQDMVEYCLMVALVSLGAVAGMRTLAGGIENSFLTLSTTLLANV